ncbi:MULTISPECIES: 2-isopropylmalate synthase [Salimicrobium]|uniref:2-isopropylmalate synthase n=2 Tax=Salimicrobium TaxID=351195 RepID=A0ABY1KLA1_9BACI|nr:MULTISPECIES: 2-isopropylmalate synthase [Salimicrobium]SDX37258.1 2-isopropylmalate synthase [Salimicrobium album]SIS47252.1 2-isopropylmalate synthase [Salimicrobium salexigens]
MADINVFDTTLRDGEQSPGVNLNRLEKLEIAKQLDRFGVDIMEAGFPVSSTEDFESVKEIAQTVKNASVTGLARCHKKDIDACWNALQYAAEPRIHVFLATSPIHMKHKLMKTEEEVISQAVEAVTYAKERFTHVQWSAEDASRSDLDFLVRIIEKVIDAGATVINLPDTVGYTTPAEYGAMFRYIRENVPNVQKADLSAHCHDDMGMAVSNTIAAIENGATQVEGTINGIGERAGNAAIEEVAIALEIRKDFYKKSININLKETKRTSDLVSRLTGMAVPGNKAVVGRNAFAHESGIHQDGVLKEASTYEIITPSMVGIDSNSLVLGKHSGRHAFAGKAEELGFLNLPEEKLKDAFMTFKDLTGKKKEVTDEDIFAILTDKQTEMGHMPQYKMHAFQVHYGNMSRPTATVMLNRPDGEDTEKAHTGEGSVEALYNTIDALVDEDIHLEDYQLSSIGRGRDALAEVHVQMTVNGEKTSGRGSAQDVLEASANAFLNAVNRTLYKHERVPVKEA